jgi:S1-C subfamily serine protease
MELPSQTGSGFVWDQEGHIVTNYHVLGVPPSDIISSSFGEYMVSFVNKDGSREGIKATVRGVDADKDVAVLRLSSLPRTFKCIDVGSSEDLRVGQIALAIGNPFGLDQTLTVGVVSGLGRQVTAPNAKVIYNMIQTDAAV